MPLNGFTDVVVIIINYGDNTGVSVQMKESRILHHKELLLHVKLMRMLQVENTCFFPVLHGKCYIEQKLTSS